LTAVSVYFSSFYDQYNASGCVAKFSSDC